MDEMWKCFLMALVVWEKQFKDHTSVHSDLFRKVEIVFDIIVFTRSRVHMLGQWFVFLGSRCSAIALAWGLQAKLLCTEKKRYMQFKWHMATFTILISNYSRFTFFLVSFCTNNKIKYEIETLVCLPYGDHCSWFAPNIELYIGNMNQG